MIITVTFGKGDDKVTMTNKAQSIPQHLDELKTLKWNIDEITEISTADDEVKEGDIIQVGNLDYCVLSTQKVSDRLPGATSGRDNLIIKATKPRGKKVFEIIQYPSGKFSSAVEK